MTAQLESIPMPNDKVFDERYVRMLTYIGISDLFADSAIRSVNTRARFIEEFGTMRIPLEDSYDDAICIPQVVKQLKRRERPALRRGETPATMARGHTAIRDYFEFQDLNPGNRHTRINFASTPEMGEYFRIPSVCRARAGEEPRVLDAFLVGNAGSFSHLHFDKDGRHGLLYQVYGRKRVIVFPYDSTSRLAPFSQFGFWFIQCLDDEERKHFLRFAGGREIVLGPGDAVFLPAYCWHYVDYLDDCCSINLRFRRPERLAWLAKHLLPDQYIQGIARALLDPVHGDAAWARARERVAELDGLSGDASISLRRAIARELHLEFVPSAHRAPYCINLDAHVFSASQPRQRHDAALSADQTSPILRSN